MEYCNSLLVTSNHWERGRIWFLELSHYIIQNVQFSRTKTITNHRKKQETTAHSQVEHKLIENIQEEAHILDILDKNYKLTLFLNMLRGLLETINK